MSLNRTWGMMLLAAALVLAGCPGEGPPPTPADQKVTPKKDGAADGSKDATTDAAGDAADAAGEASVDASLCGGVSCNDNLACTDDICTASGCTNTVKSGFCLINKTCHKDGDKNPAGSCAKCAASTSNTSWTDDSTLCPGGTLACVSATCTSGKCSTTIQSGYCVVGGVCVKDGAANPKNACRICETKKSVTSYQNAADGATCAGDNLTCTNDVCKTGQCTHAIKIGYCLINSE